MKPFGLTIADLHLSEKNKEQVRDIMMQAATLAVKEGVSYIFLAGDIYDSRKTQPRHMVIWFRDILDDMSDAGVNNVYMIPGNHDKLSYLSEDSHLDYFRDHPIVTLIRDYWEEDVCVGIRVHMIPFFEEKECFSKYLDKVDLLKGGKNILITHIAVNGVRNNDGSEVENNLKPSLFKKFHKVLVGHYHDRSVIGKNIHYIGSAAQNNFGENEDKGFTILYEDGNHSYHQSEFKKFETVKIDLNTVTTKELDEYKKAYAGSESNVRLDITGPEEKVKALAKGDFEQFKIKATYDDITVEEVEEYNGFDESKILTEWDSFSAKKKFDTNFGKELLEQAFVKQQ